MKEFKCCMCGSKVVGWGNNPEPLVDSGICCDKCYLKVIDARTNSKFPNKNKVTIELDVTLLNEEESQSKCSIEGEACSKAIIIGLATVIRKMMEEGHLDMDDIMHMVYLSIKDDE